MNRNIDTPISDFIESYIDSDFSRLHMPGHKGSSLTGFEKADITEISGADALYEADGIICKSEQNAAKLFGTKRTCYSTEGSTQCIKAMLFLAVTECEQNGDKPLILAARNVHKSFIHAAALLDFDIDWIFPDEVSSLCSCVFSPQSLEKKLECMEKKPIAVYITSPDYLGNTADIKGISEICKKNDILLLVDNAHGAYLKFIGQHPIDAGADMCCDSAHKTLPCLTGGAYLHINNDRFVSQAKIAMSLFGSTSPSYLILRSLDLVNKYLCNNYDMALKSCIFKVERLKKDLIEKGFSLIDSEPLKLTADAKKIGYSGFEIAEILRKSKIECEYADENYLVLMFTPANDERDFKRVLMALSGVLIKEEIGQNAFELPNVKQIISVRKAFFSPHEFVPAEQSEGKICAIPSVSCPPAIPIAISGEAITKEHIKLFKQFGINSIEVVK